MHLRRLTRTLLGAALAVSCAGGTANATMWNSGDVITYNQAAWIAIPEATNTLINNFSVVYASTFGVLEIGVPGTSGYSALFSSADAVVHYLPATGIPAALDTDLNNPVTTSAGVFGGDVLALQLNIDFSDAGVLTGAANVPSGDLILQGLTGTTANLNGQSVRSFAALANTALGGGSTGYAISDIDSLADLINAAFNDGTVTTFAEDHLAIGSELPPVPVPEPGSPALLVGGLVVARALKKRGGASSSRSVAV